MTAQDQCYPMQTPRVTEVAWVPLDEVAGRLGHADERRLIERVPDALAANSAGARSTSRGAE